MNQSQSLSTKIIIPIFQTLDKLKPAMLKEESEFAFDFSTRVLRLGAYYSRVKELLKHGNFEKWIKENSTIKPRMARAYMQVWEKWHDKPKEIEGIPTRIITMISMNTTSDKVAKKIIDKHKSGEKITESDIKKLKDEEKAKQSLPKEDKLTEPPQNGKNGNGTFEEKVINGFKLEPEIGTADDPEWHLIELNKCLKSAVESLTWLLDHLDDLKPEQHESLTKIRENVNTILKLYALTGSSNTKNTKEEDLLINLIASIKKHIPLKTIPLRGTSGWTAWLDEIKALIKKHGAGMVSDVIDYIKKSKMQNNGFCWGITIREPSLLEFHFETIHAQMAGKESKKNKKTNLNTKFDDYIKNDKGGNLYD